MATRGVRGGTASRQGASAAAAAAAAAAPAERFAVPGGGVVTVHAGTLATCADDVAFALLERVGAQRPGLLAAAGDDLRGSRQAWVAPGRAAEAQRAMDTLLNPAVKKRDPATRRRHSSSDDEGDDDDA